MTEGTSFSRLVEKSSTAPYFWCLGLDRCLKTKQDCVQEIPENLSFGLRIRISSRLIQLNQIDSSTIGFTVSSIGFTESLIPFYIKIKYNKHQG